MLKKSVTPLMDGGRYVIGVEPFVRLVFKKYGFVESVQLGFQKTIEAIDLTFITLKKLLSFGLSIKTLGGPVMIAQMSGQSCGGRALNVPVAPCRDQHLFGDPEPAPHTGP